MSKRIIDLQTTTGLLDDDFVMVDGPTNETKKFPIKTILDDIHAIEAGTSLEAGSVNTSAIHDAAVTNQKLASNSVGTSNLQDGSVTLAKIAGGSNATQQASGLMSSSDKTKLDAFSAASNYALKSEIAGAYIYKGSVQTADNLPTSGQTIGDVYNIVAASRYGQAGANVAWNGSAWDTLGETFEIGDGTVTTAKINDGAITGAKIGTNAVTTEKIANLNVTEGKLAGGSVTEAKIGTGAVTADKIGTGAVGSTKLATGAVTTEKITDGNVSTAKIANSGVTTAKIADLNVTTEKINNGAVTEGKLGSSAVTTGKINDAAVTEGKIAAGAVTEGKIGNGAVTADKIGANAVTEAKIYNGSVSTEKLADGAVSTNKLDGEAVTYDKLAAGSVTTPKIADLNVTEGKLANGAVATDKVADDAITRDKLNEEVTDELDFKADVDGYYTDMTVGAADNLTGRGDATTAEFLYRTAGGTADIETGQAVAKSIRGNTLVWNQLVVNPNFVDTSAWSGRESTLSVANNVATVVPNSAGTYKGLIQLATEKQNVTVVGHKYLMRADFKINEEVANLAFSFSGTSPTTASVDSVDKWNHCAAIWTAPSSDVPCRIYILILSNLTTSAQLQFKNVNAFDLTAMFGAGNEPSTVAEFEALFPEPYYEYDAGSLLSVNMEGIETVGFNQWDEEWEVGAIINSTGQNTAADNRIRSKNYIPCFPNTSYYCKGNFANGLFFYDANKQYLSEQNQYPLNAVITTPSNARYMRFCCAVAYGTTYKGDICINLSWSGRRNGEYEAFWSSQRLIDVATYFPDGMRSAGTVYDELTSTEAITRVGVVDLGEVTWTYVNNSFRASRIDIPIAPLSDNIDAPRVICPLYTPVAYNTSWNVDGTCAQELGSSGRLVLINSSYTDAAAFKAAMSGVMLHYALATPTVTPIDPALNLSYRVDDFGTERVVVPEDERSAPPVLDIAYGLNVVDFVRRAPSEYISHASFQQFCLALQTKLGIVITETWDDTDNRYEYSIADAPSSNEG